MILEHDGVVVDFFDRFPKDQNNVGLQLSGGADSTLLLYLLVKMMQESENTKDKKIYPITAHDIYTPDIRAYDNAANVIKWIEEKTKCDFIQPISITPYFHERGEKDDVVRANRLYLNQRYNCKFVLDGITLGMPGDPRQATCRWGDDDNIRELNDLYPHEFPWSIVNKKFIAAQYKKFGIEELSNLTNSCTDSSITPCKKCWWCRERYWAFGSYDYGLQ